MCSFFIGSLFAHRATGRLEARMRAGREAQAPADRLALGLMSLSLLLPIPFAAKDVFTWHYCYADTVGASRWHGGFLAWLCHHLFVDAAQ